MRGFAITSFGIATAFTWTDAYAEQARRPPCEDEVVIEQMSDADRPPAPPEGEGRLDRRMGPPPDGEG